jgi:hypothetical protein
VTYASAEARQELLDTIGDAVEDIGAALAALGEAYEQLDDRSADRLEEELFRPIQSAYSRATRTYSGFAERHALVTRPFEQTLAGVPSTGVKGFIEAAVDAVSRADADLAELQDSMRPVDVGDAELRAGLGEVRGLLGELRGHAREFVRTFGR